MLINHFKVSDQRINEALGVAGYGKDADKRTID